jgi:hypothetical protein
MYEISTNIIQRQLLGYILNQDALGLGIKFLILEVP